MSRSAVRWGPALVLGVGALFVVGIDTQRSMPLARELAEVVPDSLNGWAGWDVTMSDMEVRVSRVSEYLLRSYEGPGNDSAGMWVSLYVGYYDRQVRGKTIHSPKNCLPGAGWAPLQADQIVLETTAGPATVNRYVIQNGIELALVLYWYQGRSRVQANEYIVKWDMLRDAALRQRTEEALVRVVVPIRAGGEDAALELARLTAEEVIPALYRALPS